jgi:hypothetical protein
MEFKGTTPTEFEEMIYDLLVDMGFKNVTWLGGPADAGRDIAAQLPKEDPDGKVRLEHWVVQCKRWVQSALSHVVMEMVGASMGRPIDVFLLAVSSSLTDDARRQLQEVETGLKTRFRVWDAHDIASFIGQHPNVKLKYFGQQEPAKPQPLLSRRVLIVDDGIATGSSMKALAESLKALGGTVVLTQPKDLKYETSKAFRDFAVKQGFDLAVLDTAWAVKLGGVPLSRKEVLRRVGTLSEDEFTYNVLVPLFEKARFERVRVVHSTQERGIDIILEEKTRLGSSLWVGVQAKAANIHASRGRHNEGLVHTIALQLRDAFQMEHLVDDEKVHISRCLLVTSKSVSSEARQVLMDNFEHPVYKANIRIMDGQDVVTLASQVGLTLDFL